MEENLTALAYRHHVPLETEIMAGLFASSQEAEGKELRSLFCSHERRYQAE